jgi:hypothetical protein
MFCKDAATDMRVDSAKAALQNSACITGYLPQQMEYMMMFQICTIIKYETHSFFVVLNTVLVMNEMFMGSKSL